MITSSATSPLLSVIVPFYNSSSTIGRCIEFLLHQSLKELEIICVDDGSTDSSSNIVNQYVSKYPSRIKLLKTDTRCGPGGARNLGIASATGQYIGFVDSDDWVDSCLFSTVVEHALQSEADIAVFGVKDEYGNYLHSKIRYEYPQKNTFDNTYALRLLARTYSNDIYISPMVCQKIYKHSFLHQNNLFFALNCYSEDDQFTFCCFLHDCKIITVPNVYYHYLQRADSITHSFSRKHIDALTKMLENLRAQIVTMGLWDTHRHDFYSFSEKSIRSVINTIFSAEQCVALQKQYVSYLMHQLQVLFTIDEWIQYLDIQVIRRFLLE